MTTANSNTFNFNTFHSDAWKVSFSNLPSLSGVTDMAIFDNFVKELTLPEYSMAEVYSDSNGFRVRHPVVPKINAELGQLAITFKLNEDMKNYWTLFDWIQSMKYGDGYLSEMDLIRRYTIKSINLTVMDNQKRTIAIVRFTQAFLLSLGSLGLTTGSSEELTFPCNFSYEEILYETKSIYSC
jgi:hypothetical protein